MNKMKAVVIKGIGDLEIEEMPIPEIGKNDVLVKVEAVGICKTDREIVWGKHPSSKRIIEGRTLIPGHEWSGTVVKVGHGCKKVKKGDKVVGETSIYCGECEYCKIGYTNLCENLVEIGIDRNGAMAEYIVVPEKILHKLPDGFSFEEGALIEPTAVAVHAVKKVYECKIPTLPFDVVVFGDGPIGLLVCQAARILLKPRKTCIIGKSQRKLKIARELGCDICVDIAGKTNGEVEIIRETFYRYQIRPYIIFEAVGDEKVIDEIIEIADKLATVVFIGIEKYASINMENIIFKELKLLGSLSSPMVWEETIDLVSSGQISLSSLITRIISIENAIEFLRNSPDDDIKVVIRP